PEAVPGRDRGPLPEEPSARLQLTPRWPSARDRPRRRAGSARRSTPSTPGRYPMDRRTCAAAPPRRPRDGRRPRRPRQPRARRVLVWAGRGADRLPALWCSTASATTADGSLRAADVKCQRCRRAAPTRIVFDTMVALAVWLVATAIVLGTGILAVLAV